MLMLKRCPKALLVNLPRCLSSEALPSEGWGDVSRKLCEAKTPGPHPPHCHASSHPVGESIPSPVARPGRGAVTPN